MSMTGKVSDNLKPYWCSFFVDFEFATFEYHGPWWVSGYGPDDEKIVVAAVMATDAESAMETLRLAVDEDVRPGSLTERFCEEFGDRPLPFSDRFARADWMQWPWPQVPLQPRPVAA